MYKKFKLKNVLENKNKHKAVQHFAKTTEYPLMCQHLGCRGAPCTQTTQLPHPEQGPQGGKAVLLWTASGTYRDQCMDAAGEQTRKLLHKNKPL